MNNYNLYKTCDTLLSPDDASAKYCVAVQFEYSNRLHSYWCRELVEVDDWLLVSVGGIIKRVKVCIVTSAKTRSAIRLKSVYQRWVNYPTSGDIVKAQRRYNKECSQGLTENSVKYTTKAPVFKKDEPMQLKIETITYVDGRDVSELSDEQIIMIISQAEKEIARLEGVANAPKRLRDRATELRTKLKVFIDLIDAQDEAKAEPATEA